MRFESFYEEYIHGLARDKAELKDLRVLCYALLDRLGGKVTFKYSDLERAMLAGADERRMYSSATDYKYDSIEIWLDQERTVKE